MEKILISACLCGFPCRYDGQTQPNAACVKLMEEGIGIPFCPEAEGGLPCPRVPAELQGGDGKDVLTGTARVVTQDGRDVTDAYRLGAALALDRCTLEGITQAMLKTRSPSCGWGEVYDGSFSGCKRPGAGVTAAKLAAHGIRIIPTDKDGGQ